MTSHTLRYATIAAAALLATTTAALAPADAAAPATRNYTETFTTYPTGPWSEGSIHGRWNTVFTGYGTTSITSGNKKLSLSPKPATDTSDTHAALTVATTAVSATCEKTRADITTVTQLRTGAAPNPWETGWLLTKYVDNNHFYYLALKPNGYELGKRDPNYPGGQRFLATGNTTTKIGETAAATITVNGTPQGVTITIKKNATILATIRDTERPYTSGTTGAYTEDATATFDNIATTAC